MDESNKTTKQKCIWVCSYHAPCSRNRWASQNNNTRARRSSLRRVSVRFCAHVTPNIRSISRSRFYLTCGARCSPETQTLPLRFRLRACGSDHHPSTVEPSVLVDQSGSIFARESIITAKRASRIAPVAALCVERFASEQLRNAKSTPQVSHASRIQHDDHQRTTAHRYRRLPDGGCGPASGDR